MLEIADSTHNNLKNIACLTGGEMPQVVFLDSAPALPVKQVFLLERHMSNPWFRLYKEFATDPVVQSLAFEDQRHYIIVLCMKCDGLIDRNIAKPARERIILRTLGLDTSSGEEAKRRLIEVGLIDKNWQPITWDKRQYLSDSSTQRVRKHRKTKETGNVTTTLQKQDCNAPEAETETEAYTDTEKPTAQGVKQKASPVPYQSIIDLYHERLPDNPQIAKLTESRKRQIKARWNNGIGDIDAWERYFDLISDSKFLTGQCPPARDRNKPFIADIDFLIKEANVLKIVEGKYHE